MVLRWASDSGRARRSLAVDGVCVHTEVYRRRGWKVRIGRNMEKGTEVPTKCHLGIQIFPSFYSPLVLLVTSITHHGSITFVSQRSPAPFPAASDAPADSDVPPARFQRHSLWRTWRSGPTVRRCISYSSSPFPHALCVCAVNASELERLKKRFMKLDRCGLHSPPRPAALCPLP